MADAIVTITHNFIRLGKSTYKPDEEIEPDLLTKIRPELNGFLPPGETRARSVAEAICQLHACAMRECLAE